MSINPYKTALHENIQKLKKLQDKFYAQGTHSLLLIYQGLDGCGKDSTIKHVMSGINPQGCVVHSFKRPTKQEYDHHFLWKGTTLLPERGMIGIFNRSYYEEVVITQVHPELIVKQRIPGYNSTDKVDSDFWQKRYKQINDFEENLTQNGTIILKFFLDVSKDEQKQRFLRRIENPDKNWKLEMGDLSERKHWDNYQKVFKNVISNTNKDYAPWHRIPADNKPEMRYLVSEEIVKKMESLNLEYPTLNQDQKNMLIQAKETLEKE